jgi:Tol biopolymer transport system component/pimeloyl-ACP methyl ester carboxylesterase
MINRVGDRRVVAAVAPFRACLALSGRHKGLLSCSLLVALVPFATWTSLSSGAESFPQRVSVASGGTQGNGDSAYSCFYSDARPSFSADGRYVAFESFASNLVPGDTNGTLDVFVHERTTGQTTRVSVASGGAGCDGPSWAPFMSADGRYVAFLSYASNLVSGDTNNMADVFVHDRATNQTTRVSLASDGTQAGMDSLEVPSLSADGRFVAFSSSASNLVPGDTNLGIEDIFVRDRATGQTTRVNVASDGTQANDNSYKPSISADGRYVAFLSYASNIVPGDTNERRDTFVHDRATGQTTRVNTAADGGEHNTGTGTPVLSANGRYVAFGAQDSNLVPGDNNNAWDIFVHDRKTGETAWITQGSIPVEGADGEQSPSISADGRYVVVNSGASNLVPGDTNWSVDTFVHDRTTGQTARVNLAADGSQADEIPYAAAISPDGRYVLFISYASNLVTGDTNQAADVFVTVNPLFDSGTPSNQRPVVTLLGNSSMSLTLGSVFMDPGATASDAEDGDLTREIYVSGVVDTAVLGTTTLTYTVTDSAGQVSAPASRTVTIKTMPAEVFPLRVSGAPDGSDANAHSYYATLSANGRFIVFASDATNLVPGDTNGWGDIFIHDRTTGQKLRLSVAPDGSQANGSSNYPVISADGRYVAFCSWASNLVPGDTNGWPDIFVHDRATHQTTRVNVASDGTQANSNTDAVPSISADGRYVAFQSAASNLVPYWDRDEDWDVFVHDRVTGETTMSSAIQVGVTANGASWGPSLSSDGRYVAFRSDATNLVRGDTNRAADVFLLDRTTSTKTRLSVASDGSQANGDSRSASSLSADGQYLAFISSATNLVSGDSNGVGDVFVRDRTTSQTTRVSVGLGGVQANGASYNASIGPSGRDAAFLSTATNLVQGDTNGFSDSFVHDRSTGQTLRVNVAMDGSQANGGSNGGPSLSADGRYVVFVSMASNLAPGDANGRFDVYVSELLRLQVQKGGNGTGTVTSALPGINCGSTCSARFVNVLSVTLTATPADECTFDGWSGGVCSGTAPCVIASKADAVVTATFTRKTYAISGRITDQGSGQPLSGVTVSISPGGIVTATDANGRYSVGGLYRGSYVVTPSRAGFAFVPTTRSLNVSANVSNADFQAIALYSMSGRITNVVGGGAVSSVTVSSTSGSTATTDAAGYYAFSSVPRGTYRLTPQRSGYQFSPTSRTVSLVANLTGLDFRGGLSYVVSGRAVNEAGRPIAGVTVLADTGQNAVSDANGNFSLVVMAGSRTFTVSKNGFTFAARGAILVTGNLFGLTFIGYDMPPIVMVHGWNSNGHDTFQDGSGPNVPDALKRAGYHVELASLYTAFGYTPRVDDNVPRLVEAVDRAKAATGQPKVILIAHSMGGLVSRAYVEGSSYRGDVLALFTFGTPHQGTIIQVWGVFGSVPGGPAIFDMSEVGAAVFNATHARRAGVTYHAIGGDAPMDVIITECLDVCLWWRCWRVGCWDIQVPTWVGGHSDDRAWLGWVLGKLIPGPDDALISTDSATGLSGWLDRASTDEVHARGLGELGRFGEFTYFNHGFTQQSDLSRSYYQCLKKVLVDKSTSTCGRQGYEGRVPTTAVAAASAGQMSLADRGASSALDEPVVSVDQHSPIATGTLRRGTTKRHPVLVEGGVASFGAHWTNGTVGFRLIDPSGQTIDPAFATDHSGDVTYAADANSAIYYFRDAVAGRWQMVLDGARDIAPAGSQYSAFGIVQSNLVVSSLMGRNWYSPGDTAEIDVILSEVPRDAQGTATVLYNDGSQQAVALSSGAPGRLAAAFTVANAPGYARVDLRVRGTRADGAPFERGQQLLFQASPRSATLTGAYADAPEPRAGTPALYQALNLSMGVNASFTGRLGLSAELVDGTGALVAHSAVTKNVAAGTNTLVLSFAGEDLFNSGRSGPYTLTNLLLTDEREAVLVVAEARNVYTTQSYDSRAFAQRAGFPTASAGGPYSVDEGGTVTLTASGRDPEGDPITFAWDLDGDGVFETPGQSVTFSAAGIDGPSSESRIVSVMVTDSNGDSAVAQTTVDVVNVAPVVSAGGDAEIQTGETFARSVSFSDLGPDTWTATVDFGDGTGVQSLPLAGTSFELSHRYTEIGKYHVAVTVSDDDGGKGSATFTVTVSQQPGDLDGDGVGDGVDACPYTSPDSTVVLGECNTGVKNSVSATGCSILDQIGLCVANAEHRGGLARCVATLTARLTREGTISHREGLSIRRCVREAERHERPPHHRR